MTSSVAQRVCKVEGCDRKHRAKGMCSSHYNASRGGYENRVVEMECAWCAEKIFKRDRDDISRRYCGSQCRSAHRASGNAQPPRSAAPIRAALEAQDWPGVIEAIKAQTILAGECWNWTGYRNAGGYGMCTAAGGRSRFAHRIALHAALTGGLGDEPVHHRCANRLCVNPDHLVPVTQAENNAEMLARTYMTRRIGALEAALRVHEPDHPLLSSTRTPTP